MSHSMSSPRNIQLGKLIINGHSRIVLISFNTFDLEIFYENRKLALKVGTNFEFFHRDNLATCPV